MQSIQSLIYDCKKGNRQSQAKLYALLSPKMMVVCLRYSRNTEEAEESLQEGFMKVFEHINTFKFEGSFEGWVRKIMVNCSLQKYRTKQPMYALVQVENEENIYSSNETITTNLSTKELLTLVQQLPTAYRLVFNLYVFENMKHREISELLGISEGTSKSNLFDARSILQKAVTQQSKIAKQRNL